MPTRLSLPCLLGLVLAVTAPAAEPPQPGSGLPPERVVAIQLDALQHNDEPERDAEPVGTSGQRGVGHLDEPVTVAVGLHRGEEQRRAGIARAWQFAHPDNRAMTGPLERFTAMLKSPPYAPLLNHRRHAIEPVGRGDSVAVFLVTIVARRGPVLAYQWTLRRIESGRLAGAWMTVAVSPPVKRGDSI